MATSVEYISVLPDGIAADKQHRYLRLPHPRSGLPQLYLPTSDALYEVVRLSGSSGRTWFHGEQVSRGDILVHAPFDPFFLAVPIALSLIPTDRTGPFQPLPDLLASAASSPSWALRPAFAPNASPETWNKDIGRLAELKPFVRAFEACCERKLIPGALPSPPPESSADITESATSVVAAKEEEGGYEGRREGGDEGGREDGEKYYRPSREKILAVLKRKVAHVVSHTEEFDHLVRALGRDGLLGAEPALLESAKQRAAIDTIAAYLPSALVEDLVREYDFAALETHLADRAAASAPTVPEVKEKKAAASKRKAAVQGSRGVEALKKVDTKGMPKMTSFFKKAEK